MISCFVTNLWLDVVDEEVVVVVVAGVGVVIFGFLRAVRVVSDVVLCLF